MLECSPLFCHSMRIPAIIKFPYTLLVARKFAASYYMFSNPLSRCPPALLWSSMLLLQ